MNKQHFPYPEKVKQTVSKMRETCRQFDNLNLKLDELIVQIEADIINSTLTAYCLGKTKVVTKDEL